MTPAARLAAALPPPRRLAVYDLARLGLTARQISVRAALPLDEVAEALAHAAAWYAVPRPGEPPRDEVAELLLWAAEAHQRARTLGARVRACLTELDSLRQAATERRT